MDALIQWEPELPHLPASSIHHFLLSAGLRNMYLKHVVVMVFVCLKQATRIMLHICFRISDIK